MLNIFLSPLPIMDYPSRSLKEEDKWKEENEGENELCSKMMNDLGKLDPEVYFIKKKKYYFIKKTNQ